MKRILYVFGSAVLAGILVLAALHMNTGSGGSSAGTSSSSSGGDNRYKDLKLK